MSTPTAVAILKRIQHAISKEYESEALQANPHVVLLDLEFYHRTLKPLLAEWALLWMEQHSFTGISREETLYYIMEGANHNLGLKEKINKGVSARDKQMLNLAYHQPLTRSLGAISHTLS